MRGLVWKELREWGPPCAALLVVICLGWCLAAPARDVPRRYVTTFVPGRSRWTTSQSVDTGVDAR